MRRACTAPQREMPVIPSATIRAVESMVFTGWLSRFFFQFDAAAAQGDSACGIRRTRIQYPFGRGTDRMASLPADIVACPDCDLLQRMPALPPGRTARCARCGLELGTCKPGSLDRSMALSVAALIVYLLANVEPLMGVSIGGRTSSTTILGGVQAMWLQGEKVTSVLVALFIIVAPALDIVFMLAILVASRRPPAPRWVGSLLRWTELSGVWSMVGVMMLGILVSLVKIASLATVEPGIGIFAVGALVFLLAGMSASFEPREIWSRVRWANGEWPGTVR